ncbi:3-dehydroquinate synthase [Wenyingzhuangia sp. IMCC45574]
MNKNIQQNFQVQFNYNISFTEHVFGLNNHLLADLLTTTHKNMTPKIAVVIDKGMFLHHPNLIDEIKAYFTKHCLKAELQGDPLLVKSGEAIKNDWNSVDQILNLLNEQKIDRHSYTLAIGGGAVLDTVGFACAIAHRGVRLIRIPTTVLSQNDSGVGVKNSVNYFDKKNFLGTFQPPFAVINDLTFLETLSNRDYRSGISEAIKVALIKDPVFFNWIETNLNALNNREAKAMEHLIFRCAELHTDHIASGDPFEMGSSRPLDFGHWAAHKLEYLTQYKVTHGEAVAIGIVLDACYSYKIGYLSENELLRILNCFKILGFDLTHPLLYNIAKKEMNPELIRGLEEFREHLGGVLTIMLLTKIGKGEEVHEINVALLNEAAQYTIDFLNT